MNVRQIKWTKDIERALEIRGCVLFENAIQKSDAVLLSRDLDEMLAKRQYVQKRNGLAAPIGGACHHLLGENNQLDAFVAALPLHDVIRRYFEGPYILNSFGGFSNEKEHGSYVKKIHRDVRTFSRDFKLLLNMLVLLDDFNVENGCTQFLAGSHLNADKPDDEFFKNNAEHLAAPAGSIFVFNSNMWHAAGENRTDKKRRGLTLTFSRPFFKQQLDYPRYLGANYAAALRPDVRQVLGFDSRPPTTVNEFYQPPERRTYKSDQG